MVVLARARSRETAERGWATEGGPVGRGSARGALRELMRKKYNVLQSGPVERKPAAEKRRQRCLGCGWAVHCRHFGLGATRVLPSLTRSPPDGHGSSCAMCEPAMCAPAKYARTQTQTRKRNATEPSLIVLRLSGLHHAGSTSRGQLFCRPGEAHVTEGRGKPNTARANHRLVTQCVAARARPKDGQSGIPCVDARPLTHSGRCTLQSLALLHQRWQASQDADAQAGKQGSREAET
jgi:hypothetical protein